MVRVTKETVRKYYKYTETAWTQPILTANGTMGGDSFACTASSYMTVYYPYFAFASGEPAYASAWATTTTQSTYDWYNPEPIKITNIRIKNGIEANYSITEGSVLGSNDYSTWTTLKTFTNSTTTALAEWDIDLSDNTELYKYYRISITKGNPTYVAIGRMYLTAYIRTTEPGTSSDYDYYRDTEIYKPSVQVERSYYKYSYSSWTRPDLTENGVVGWDNFAVKGSTEQTAYSREAYKAVDGSSSTYWAGSVANTGWFEFYNPNPLCVTGFSFNSIDAGYPTSVTLYGGDTEGDLVELTGFTYTPGINATIDFSTNTSYYKIYRILSNGQSYSNTVFSIGELGLTATQRITSPGTSSDYDYYVDKNNYYFIGY